MQTVIGALILIILGCVAIYGYLTESRSADRLRQPASPPRPEPAPHAAAQASEPPLPEKDPRAS